VGCVVHWDWATIRKATGAHDVRGFQEYQLPNPLPHGPVVHEKRCFWSTMFLARSLLGSRHVVPKSGSGDSSSKGGLDFPKLCGVLRSAYHWWQKLVWRRINVINIGVCQQRTSSESTSILVASNHPSLTRTFLENFQTFLTSPCLSCFHCTIFIVMHGLQVVLFIGKQMDGQRKVRILR
jgi:hypothetical protein